MKKRKIPKLYVGVTAGMVIGAASLVTGCGEKAPAEKAEVVSEVLPDEEAPAEKTEVVSEVLPDEETPLANTVTIEDMDTPLAAPETEEGDDVEIDEQGDSAKEEESKNLYTITPIPRSTGILTPEPEMIIEDVVPLYGPPPEEEPKSFADWLFGD